MKRTPIARPRLGNPAADRWAQQITDAIRSIDSTSKPVAPSSFSAGSTVITSTPAGEAVTPTVPMGLLVTGAYSTITLRWTMPTYLGHSVTQVFRNTVDNFGTAEVIHETSLAIWADAAGPGARYYYWLRFKNINNEQGPINKTAGTLGETALDLDDLFSLLNGEITELYLSAGLVQSISLISTVSDAVTEIDEILASLSGAFDANGDGIVDLDERLIALQMQVGSNKTVTDSGFVTVTDGMLQYSTMLDGTFAEVEKVAGRIYAIENVFNDPLTGHAATRAVLLQEYYTKTSADSAIATMGDTLLAVVNDPLTGLANAYANISALSQAVVNDEGGIISQTINTYQIGVDGGTASLSELASLSYDTSNAFTAQWGIKTEVGSLTGGIGLLNTGTEVLLALQFDKLATIDPITNAVTNLFSLVQNDAVIPDGVYINAAFIKVATIAELVAGDVNADTVTAGLSISSPEINGGTLTGGRYIAESGAYTLDIDPSSTLSFWYGLTAGTKNINDSLVSFTRSGEVYMRGLVVRNAANEVMMDVNGVNGAYINNLAVDTLQIADNAITVKSFVETVSVDFAKNSTGAIPSVFHDHDGALTGGSMLVQVYFAVFRTSAGSGSDHVDLTVQIKDGVTVLKSKVVRAGQAYDANQTYFVPLMLFVDATFAASLEVVMLITTGGESFRIRAEVMIDSAKR